MAEETKERLNWRIVRRHDPLDFHVFRVRQHEALHPLSGESHVFTVIDSADWVNVVALTPEDEVVMVRQFRHGTERVTLEIPGGLVDPGETPLEAAIRELREETGHAAREWRFLGRVEPNPAIQSNRCSLFLALDAEHIDDLSPDPGEVMVVERHSLAGVEGKIRSGEVDHALVVAAFAYLVFEAGGWRRPV